jgi:hypothetical protein
MVNYENMNTLKKKKSFSVHISSILYGALVVGAVSLLPIITREWLLGQVEVVGRDSMCVIWSN